MADEHDGITTLAHQLRREIQPYQKHEQDQTDLFYSSRRRHTSCGRDWSSDVCSSDLVYPRATSQHAGLFKRFNLSLTNNPAINGRTVVDTLNSGQQLFVQTLLPLNPSITSTFAAG